MVMIDELLLLCFVLIFIVGFFDGVLKKVCVCLQVLVVCINFV